MPSNLPRLVTRVTDKTESKIKILAEKEHRTLSKELEHIIEEYINNYEKEHGEIEITEEA